MTSAVGVPVSSGLLVDGAIVPVPGVTVIGAHDAAWAHLSPGDCRPRVHPVTGKRVRPTQWMLHKTVADDPEHLIPGRGPSGDAGGARATADYWAKDPRHSGAHLVTGHDGELACLADLVLVEAYHATVSNLYAIGHETKELVGGGFYGAAAETTVDACMVGCEAVGIQLQCPRQYTGRPISRMLDGGATCVGIFGHRDNTTDRSRWDPGDILFAMLRQRGVLSFDFELGEDLAFWKPIQRDLNRHGYGLVLDGIPGPRTTAALASEGYRGGIYALGKGS